MIPLIKVKLKETILGTGNYGTIRKGVYEGKNVAVKIPFEQSSSSSSSSSSTTSPAKSKRLAAGGGSVRRIVNNFELLNAEDLISFDHKNVVKYYGCTMVNERKALVMEYAPKGSLWVLLQKERLNIQTINHLLIGIAQGMRYLHAKGIMHRDLKPGNILVDNDYTAKITDFGTARFSNNYDASTIVGTLNYMAPEIRDYISEGKAQKYSKQADIYSFGAVVLVMISCEYAKEPSSYDTIESQIPSYCFPQYKELIINCCKRDSRLRPSFNQIINTLKSFNEKVLSLLPNYPTNKDIYIYHINQINQLIINSKLGSVSSSSSTSSKPPMSSINIWDEFGMDQNIKFTEDHGQRIKYITLNKLIEIITTPLHTDLIDQVLCVYQSFCTSNELLNKLKQRFKVPLQHSHIERSVQTCVLNVLNTWITGNYCDFTNDIIISIKQFLQDNRLIIDDLSSPSSSVSSSPSSPSTSTSTSLLLNCSTLLTNLESKQQHIQQPKISPDNTPHLLDISIEIESLLFDKIYDNVDCDSIASHMMLLDLELLKCVTTTELLSLSSTGLNGHNLGMGIGTIPNIYRMIKRYQKLSELVTQNRLSGFIKLAKQCKSISNYSAFMSIFTGLEKFESPSSLSLSSSSSFTDQMSTSTTTMSPTIMTISSSSSMDAGGVEEKSVIQIDHLSWVVEQYKGLVLKSNGVIIPWISSHIAELVALRDQKDIVVINDQIPMINFEKHTAVYNEISYLKRCQQQRIKDILEEGDESSSSSSSSSPLSMPSSPFHGRHKSVGGSIPIIITNIANNITSIINSNQMLKGFFSIENSSKNDLYIVSASIKLILVHDLFIPYTHPFILPKQTSLVGYIDISKQSCPIVLVTKSSTSSLSSPIQSNSKYRYQCYDLYKTKKIRIIDTDDFSII